MVTAWEVASGKLVNGLRQEPDVIEFAVEVFALAGTTKSFRPARLFLIAEPRAGSERVAFNRQVCAGHGCQ
jgi:hypothetical protein